MQKLRFAFSWRQLLVFSLGRFFFTFFFQRFFFDESLCKHALLGGALSCSRNSFLFLHHFTHVLSSNKIKWKIYFMTSTNPIFVISKYFLPLFFANIMLLIFSYSFGYFPYCFVFIFFDYNVYSALLYSIHYFCNSVCVSSFSLFVKKFLTF